MAILNKKAGKVIIDDRALLEAMKGAKQSGCEAGANFTVREAQKLVRRTNQHGWFRSDAGEAPHTSGGKPHPGISWQRIPNNGGAQVGVLPNALHLWFMEAGTEPHTITAKNAPMLRIPWRAEGNGRREPTEQEIHRLGLVLLPAPYGGQEWVYFRKSINHPGNKPRPWLLPTVERIKDRLAQLIAGETKSQLKRTYGDVPKSSRKTPRFYRI